MNRTQYRQERARIRANGTYALRWMDEAAAATMKRLVEIQEADDQLALRQKWNARKSDMHGRATDLATKATNIRLTCDRWILDLVRNNTWFRQRCAALNTEMTGLRAIGA